MNKFIVTNRISGKGEFMDTKELDKLAKDLIDVEVLYEASPLVEYLMEDEDLEIKTHTANRWYCPHCECVATHCHDLDDTHEYIIVKVKSWYLIAPNLVNDLEKAGEVVISITDLDLYFWGRQDSLQPIIKDGLFQEIALKRQGNCE
jgi:hypothetical protein